MRHFLVTLLAALTLAPAVLAVASLFGLLEPRRSMRTRTWRRIGTAVVRWPGPVLVVSLGIALIGLLALPGYKTSYDQRRYLPGSALDTRGRAVAISSAKPKSAVVSVSTSGVLVPCTPAAVMAGTSKLL